MCSSDLIENKEYFIARDTHGPHVLNKALAAARALFNAERERSESESELKKRGSALASLGRRTWSGHAAAGVLPVEGGVEQVVHRGEVPQLRLVILYARVLQLQLRGQTAACGCFRDFERFSRGLEGGFRRPDATARLAHAQPDIRKIGRASCRERV